MPLTDITVKSAKPREKDYKLTDERGLYLHVKVNGSKLWRFKFRFDGKEKLMALGTYPSVLLKEARLLRDDARKSLVAGINPMDVRREQKITQKIAADNSFETVARAWWENWKKRRTSDRHVEQTLRRLEANVFPSIGSRPISQVQPRDIAELLRTMDKRGVNDLAKRAHQTVSQVFRFAIANSLADVNPAAHFKPSDIIGSRPKTNMARVASKELPELLRRIESYQGTPYTRLAMKLMALTFVRTSELINARWDEFDFDDNVWTIPAERMKMRREHLVPLANQTLNALQMLHRFSGHRELLFPGVRDHDKPMSNNTILKALERMGYKGEMTGHGFRGIASTQLHEMNFVHQHIEVQLAHGEKDPISGAYNHALYLPQRTEMMQAWADYLDQCVLDNVKSGRFKASLPAPATEENTALGVH